MFINNVFLLISILIVKLNAQLFDDYSSSDDLACDNCSSMNDKSECLGKQVEYFNYKLVRSIFNFGKSAIYHGIWINRNEKADKTLFERVLNETLKEYELNMNLTGNLDYLTIDTIVRDFYLNISDYSNGNMDIDYDKYPSLKCPTPCTYDLITWQTLFGLSVAIFLLAFITITIYSVYLHKQYSILRDRLGKNVKYTKVQVTS
jgi:hypothetical protein